MMASERSCCALITATRSLGCSPRTSSVMVLSSQVLLIDDADNSCNDDASRFVPQMLPQNNVALHEPKPNSNRLIHNSILLRKRLLCEWLQVGMKVRD